MSGGLSLKLISSFRKMKKPKPETKPAGTLADPNPAGKKSAGRSYLGVKIGDLPSTEQLSLIAAMLARNTSDSPSRLSDTAMEIWLASRERIYIADLKDETRKQLSQWEDSVNNLRRSLDHFTNADFDQGGTVISRDTFFKRVLPPSQKNRSYDLAKVGKAFVRSLFQKQFNKEASGDEFTDYYMKWNAGDLTQATALYWEFMIWRGQSIRESRRTAGLNSAAKRISPSRSK